MMVKNYHTKRLPSYLFTKPSMPTPQLLLQHIQQQRRTSIQLHRILSLSPQFKPHSPESPHDLQIQAVHHRQFSEQRLRTRSPSAIADNKKRASGCKTRKSRRRNSAASAKIVSTFVQEQSAQTKGKPRTEILFLFFHCIMRFSSYSIPDSCYANDC